MAAKTILEKSLLSEIKADILIVDDTPENLRLLNQILSQYYKVRLAPSGIIGLAAARSTPPDLILLDIMMPAMNGFEVATQLKADQSTADIPIIFMSALDDTDSKVRGFAAGGIDYITKPFQEVEVLARVRTHMSVHTLYKRAQAEIAERMRAENDLRESEFRIRALLSAVPDTMYRIRRDGVFLDFKASSNDLLFAPPDQITGAMLMDILDEPLAKKFMTCLTKVLENQEIQTLEYTLKKDDASRVFEARFKDSGAEEVTVIVRDISDRARLEQMKSDFINRATHELRTPIAAMILMVELLDGKISVEERAEYWEILKNELGRERTLVEDLLSAGRLESDQAQWKFRLIDVAKIAQQTLAQFEMPAREKAVTMSFQTLGGVDESSFVILADEKSLVQVFVNLVGNAIKFTPTNGNVNIVLKRIDAGLQISISDTGIGIPSEDIPMLFNRFFRGTNAIDEEIQGTGIGLFIVQSILEKHKGTIKVRSKLGQGTQFDIWLPIDQKENP